MRRDQTVQPRYRRSHFGSWVARYGVGALVGDVRATGLSLHATAVYHWLAGRALRRRDYIRTLVRLSRTAISPRRLSEREIYLHWERAHRSARPPAENPTPRS